MSLYQFPSRASRDDPDRLTLLLPCATPSFHKQAESETLVPTIKLIVVRQSYAPGIYIYSYSQSVSVLIMCVLLQPKTTKTPRYLNSNNFDPYYLVSFQCDVNKTIVSLSFIDYSRKSYFAGVMLLVFKLKSLSVGG